MIDFAAARRLMVDGQVRTADVTDPRLLAAMLGLPRERFFPAEKAPLAYLDLFRALQDQAQDGLVQRGFEWTREALPEELETIHRLGGGVLMAVLGHRNPTGRSFDELFQVHASASIAVPPDHWTSPARTGAFSRRA